MAVFKRKRGGDKADGVWTVQVADHLGIRRRIPGFASRAASTELERNILKLVSIRQAGGTPDAESNRFLESASAGVRDKLAAWGVIEGARAAAGKAMTEHIGDWRLELAARGNTPRHVKNFTAKITAVARCCGWNFLSDIRLPGAQHWLAEQRREGLSAATCNAYIRAAKGFCGWLVKAKRLSENPLGFWSLLNEKADRRIERHAYTVDELGRLIAAAEDGSKHHGMSGADRALLYRTAADTGFRWSELHSMTRASFNFGAEPAEVTVKAAYTKNGKPATLPLRPDLAADLKARMALFLPDAKAFSGMWKGKGAEMIREDLEAAGVLSRNDRGALVTTDEYGFVYDFHDLRHTFGTLLNKAKVPLATAQRLMRHSDPKLTANIYTHVLIDDKAEALANLPTIAARRPADEPAAKTGREHKVFGLS